MDTGCGGRDAAGMRPFRFGLVCDEARSGPASAARCAADAGYATLLFPDHTGMIAPMPSMVAAVAAAPGDGSNSASVRDTPRTRYAHVTMDGLADRVECVRRAAGRWASRLRIIFTVDYLLCHDGV
jgi:hypothetical protein